MAALYAFTAAVGTYILRAEVSSANAPASNVGGVVDLLYNSVKLVSKAPYSMVVTLAGSVMLVSLEL